MEELLLSDYLATLPDNQWAFWRWVCVRSAGFPMVHALKLADSAAVDSANRLLDAIEQAKQHQDAALDAINKGLDDLRAMQQWDSTARRDALMNARHRLKKGQVPQASGLTSDEVDAIAAFQNAIAAVGDARAAFTTAFAAAAVQIGQRIIDVVGMSRFREALIWQNRHAFHTGLESLLKARDAGARKSKHRQHEELIANYLQRYCLKNDTIGFFGPVGWARLIASETTIKVRPGSELIAARKVSFEQWSIDTLAEALSRNKWFRPSLAPRRLAHIYVNGTMLHLPSKKPVQISPAQAAVLQACDGTRSAKVITAELSKTHPFLVKSEMEVYKLLEDLCAKGMIAWTLEIPFGSGPEHNLRRVLERIKDRSLREPALQMLSEIEAARDAVANAAGDAEQLDQAIGKLEATFTRLTGTAPTRSAGAAYAARTLIYEDCRRDIEIEIGSILLEALGNPLSLLLLSARWFTFEARTLYSTAFKELYQELVAQTGSPIIDMATFWSMFQARMLGNRSRIAATVQQSFQERWAQVLAIPPGERCVTYSSAELEPHVRAAFAAPHPGWQAARYHSPDVMIAAESVEAIQRGDYQFVMGELHIGSNTLRGSFFIEQHPCPEDLFRTVEQDFPDPRVIPVIPRDWPEITSRTRPDFVTPKDFRLAFSNDACGMTGDQVLPIGNLVVVDTEDGLIVQTRDARVQFDIIEFFADILSLEVVDGFKVLGPTRHSPRVSIDRVVICRETWRFKLEELRFAAEKDEAERFLATRRWMREHDIPRWAFVKTPTERKPFFVDFDSPILMNMFSKMIRRSLDSNDQNGLIVVTEMLPAFGETWLMDADDQRYTSELRIVAVDQAAYHVSAPWAHSEKRIA